MKVYLAGPLFTLGEQEFNLALAARLTSAGHDVWVPQTRESDNGATRQARNRTARDIFQKDLEGLNWAECVVAIMDGPDPDSGTSWECGYTYAEGKPTVLVRTDFRAAGEAPGIPYNAMLSGSVDEQLELPLRPWMRSPPESVVDGPVRVVPGSVEIVRLPGMAKSGPYPAPIPFGGRGKDVNQAGFSDHFPIVCQVIESE